MGLEMGLEQTRPQRKLKLLGLHGFRTSGDILRRQLSKWGPSLHELFDVVCITHEFIHALDSYFWFSRICHSYRFPKISPRNYRFTRIGLTSTQLFTSIRPSFRFLTCIFFFFLSKWRWEFFWDLVSEGRGECGIVSCCFQIDVGQRA